MKNIFKVVLVLFNLLVLFSCTNSADFDAESGKIILKLPDSSVKSERTVDTVDSLEFNIVVTNSDTGAVKSAAGAGGQSFSFELSAGFYTVKVTAYEASNPDDILYEGENSVQVIAGKTTPVTIKLTKVKDDDSGNNIGNEPGDEGKDDPGTEGGDEGTGGSGTEGGDEGTGGSGTEGGDDEKNSVINFTNSKEYIVLRQLDASSNPNETYSYYQSDAFAITDLFNGKLPQEKETYNLVWKGRSTGDVKNLYIYLFNIDANGNWDSLYGIGKDPEPVATSITAGEEFEINVNIEFYKTAADSVYVCFDCGKDDTDGPFCLYTGTENVSMEDFNAPVISISQDKTLLNSKYNIVFTTKPGNKYLAELKAKGCDGFIIGIVDGTNDSNWFFSKTIKLDDDAFNDIDVTSEFNQYGQSMADKSSIVVVLDFYKNVDLDGREWLEKVKSPLYKYTYEYRY